MELKAVRAELKDELVAAGFVNVYSYLPERFSPPAVLVSASDNYLVEGLTTCLMKVSLVATAIAGVATNVNETDSLDDMIEGVIMASGGWYIDRVSAPFILEANNANYLASKISLSQEYEIGG